MSSRLPLLAPSRKTTQKTSNTIKPVSKPNEVPILALDIDEEDTGTCAASGSNARPPLNKEQISNRLASVPAIPTSASVSTSAKTPASSILRSQALASLPKTMTTTSPKATTPKASTSNTLTRSRVLTTLPKTTTPTKTPTNVPAIPVNIPFNPFTNTNPFTNIDPLIAVDVDEEEEVDETVPPISVDQILAHMSAIARIEELRLRENAWNESGHLVSEDGETGEDKDWTLNNSLEFPDFVNQRYHQYRLTRGNEISCDSQEESELFEYQKFVKAYISNESPFRGILLYYGLGAGKTRASIEIARQFADEGNMCLFLSKAKLIYNFTKELAKWGWTWGSSLTFTTENYEQFVNENVRSGNLGRRYLEQFGVGYAAYNASNSLCQLQAYVDPKTNRITNKVIIIDEVHNLAQKLSNGLNAGTTDRRDRTEAYYRLLMETENCRFVTLTGTPIINLSSELAVLFNLLRGPIPIPKDYPLNMDLPSHVEVKKRGYFELFPIRKDVFNNFFVENKKPTNVNIFQNRIQGLVSYYSGAKGMVYPEMVDENGEPTKFPVVVEVPMSETQALWYEFRRKTERANKKSSTIDTIEEGIMAGDDEIKGNFRVFSRMAGNFGFPLDIQNYIAVGKREKEDIEEILDILDQDKEEYFGANLGLYSAKMEAIINTMDLISDYQPQKDGGVLIYSNFREVEGIALMARALLEHGYTEYKPGDENKPGFEYDGRKFAILGSKDGEATQKAIQTYNSIENLFLPDEESYEEYQKSGGTTELVDNMGDSIPYIGAGRIVKILLGTEVISEGIDLFNIRQVHILEPHWNFVRIDQTIGRARRVCSHKNLPQEYWTFTAWIYLATLDKSITNVSKDINTTDQIIYGIAKEKKKINDVFQLAIKEAAVDCTLNASHNTEVTATGQRINCMVLPKPSKSRTHAYYPDLRVDLDKPRYEVSKVKTRDRVILGKYKSNDAIFSPSLFPEIWKNITVKGKQYRDVKYLVQINASGEIQKTAQGNEVRITLFDKEAADSTGEPIAVGYISLKPRVKPVIVWA